MLPLVQLEVAFVATVAHLRLVDDGAALRLVVDLFHGEGVAEYVLGQPLPPLCVIPLQAHAVVNAEAGGVAPLHDLHDQLVAYLAFFLEHLEYGCAKQLLQRRQVDPGHDVEGLATRACRWGCQRT